MRRLTLLLIAAFVMLCAGCDSGNTASGGLCGAVPEFAYSEDLARNLDERLSPYLHGATGEFTLQTTSQEVNSWLTYTAIKWPALPLRDAAVWFSPEHIHFSGVVSQILPFSIAVQFQARVWLDGKTPQLAVEEACLGRFALPSWARRMAERIANETIIDSGPYVRLDALVIRDGEMYAIGRLGR